MVANTLNLSGYGCINNWYVCVSVGSPDKWKKKNSSTFLILSSLFSPRWRTEFGPQTPRFCVWSIYKPFPAPAPPSQAVAQRCSWSVTGKGQLSGFRELLGLLCFGVWCFCSFAFLDTCIIRLSWCFKNSVARGERNKGLNTFACWM